MDVANKNTMLITLTLINNTESIFWREEVSPDSKESSFPLKIYPYSSNTIVLEGIPHLRQDITIDYGVKKSVFNVQALYTNYKSTVSLHTQLLFSRNQTLHHGIPRVDFFWNHGLTSVGTIDIACTSRLTNKTTSYPYCYALEQTINP